MLFWALALLAMKPNYEVVKTFAPLPDESEEYLSNPYAMAFAPDGRLFLVDSKTTRIHVWDPDGKYLTSFGTQGRGPGEMFLPATIEATETHLWVWDLSARLTKFTLDGSFVNMVKVGNIRPRDFAVLNDDLLLVAHKHIAGPREILAVFALFDAEGKELKVLKQIPIESYLTPREGANVTTTKAFAPEFDIEKIGGDRWYFGFSQSRTLYEVDAAGRVVGEKVFDLPAEKPSDEDKILMQNLRGPVITGEVFSIKELPNLTINYDYDKAFYTHILIGKGKIAFVLTPLGGMTGCGNGFWQATYQVNDFESGKRVFRGHYRFPENSLVLYRDGRVLGVLLNEEGEFQIAELALRGM